MSGLKNYEGFIPDAIREENAIQLRMQEKLKESKHLSRYLEELEALRIRLESFDESSAVMIPVSVDMINHFMAIRR